MTDPTPDAATQLNSKTDAKTDAKTEMAAQLARRVEEASLNAWPALQQQFYDGWVLRFAKGFTKRANSIVPLYPALPGSLVPIEERVRYCENLYAREQLHTIFRLTSISPYPGLDDFLARRGYSLLDPAVVQLRQFSSSPPTPQRYSQTQNPTRFATVGIEPWLEIYSQLAQVPEAAKQLHGAILSGIQALCGFGVLFAGAGASERPVACGLAVTEAHFVGLFDVITAQDQRQQGYGQLLVEQLLRWGATAGATSAYLQMLEANKPAAVLYQGLDFHPLYRYWFRAA